MTGIFTCLMVPTELTMTGSEDSRVVCHPEQAVADSRIEG